MGKDRCPSCGQPISVMAAYRGQVLAGDPVAWAVDQACQAAGVRVLMSSLSTTGKSPVGTTIAVGNMKLIAKHHGGHALTRVLKVLVAAKRGPIKASEIAAAAQVLLGCRAKDEDLVAVIASKTAEDWAACAGPWAVEQRKKLADVIAAAWAHELGYALKSVPREGVAIDAPSVAIATPSRAVAPGVLVEPMTSDQSQDESARDDHQASSPGTRGWRFEVGGEDGRPRAADPVPKPDTPPLRTDRWDHRERLRDASVTLVRLKPGAQRAPTTLPAVPLVSTESVAIGDARLEIATGILSRGSEIAVLRRSETIRIVAALARVAPSLLDHSRLIRAAYGPDSKYGNSMLRDLIDGDANIALRRFGYHIKWVQHVGCTLQPVG